MTEAGFTRKLLTELRRRMPNAMIIKFNDRTTSGIPDFCIVRDGVTRWYEVKYNNKKPYEPLQWETLRRMEGSYIIVDRSWASVFSVTQKYEHRSADIVNPHIGSFCILVQKLIVATT